MTNSTHVFSAPSVSAQMCNTRAAVENLFDFNYLKIVGKREKKHFISCVSRGKGGYLDVVE